MNNIDQTIKAAYMYFLCNKNIASCINNSGMFSLYEKYRIKRGKFWCWHDCTTFDVIFDGTDPYFEDIKSLCKKCGWIGYTRRVKIDERLVNFSGVHVRYM